MGATSSCINDIANDDFLPILHIEEVFEENNRPNNEDSTEVNSKNLSVPAIHTSPSDDSISNILDLLDNEQMEGKLLTVPQQAATTKTSEMRSSGSDVSISFFLDRELSGDPYDEFEFANVNSNVLSPQNSEHSNRVKFSLDK